MKIQSKAKIVGLMALMSLSAASCAADDTPEEGAGGLAAASGSGGTSSAGTSGMGGNASGGGPNGGTSGAMGGANPGASGAGTSSGAGMTSAGTSGAGTGGVAPMGGNGGVSPGGVGGAGASGAGSGGMAQAGGTGGAAGMTASGGTSSGTGGATGGSSGNGGTGGSDGACQKGTVAGNEVLVIGDSFIAINHAITNEVERLAREAGALDQNEDYQDRSVSGTTLANNQIPGQYTAAANQGPIKVVLMNGGGNDCLQNNNGDAAVAAATTLFETMGDEGTEAVVYFFYPDPQGALGAGSLKSCLDMARPKMEMLCESLTAPKCYFIDLRPVFEGKYSEYVSGDGIHPTTAGGNAAGQAIWKTMQDNCIAQ